MTSRAYLTLWISLTLIVFGTIYLCYRIEQQELRTFVEHGYTQATLLGAESPHWVKSPCDTLTQ